jgi:hypothetical protein
LASKTAFGKGGPCQRILQWLGQCLVSLNVIWNKYGRMQIDKFKSRAKSDRWNSITAGCISGGLLAYNTGPTGIAFGCGSFAAFSAAIDCN